MLVFPGHGGSLPAPMRSAARLRSRVPADIGTALLLSAFPLETPEAVVPSGSWLSLPVAPAYDHLDPTVLPAPEGRVVPGDGVGLTVAVPLDPARIDIEVFRHVIAHAVRPAPGKPHEDAMGAGNGVETPMEGKSGRIPMIVRVGT